MAGGKQSIMADKKFWSERIQAQTPYIAGEQPKLQNLVKLNTNENPYPPSPKVLDAIKTAATGDLRLYPPVPDERTRFWGNGSDEILAMAYIAFFGGRKLYAPDISYSFYPVWAKMFDAEYNTVPLNDDFSIPIEPFCHLDGNIVIANPNAPTSLALSLSDVEKIVSTNSNNLVLIDEAYMDFCNESSAVELVDRYDNLLVVRTMSKSYSLAGMRIGWAIGNENLISALRVVRDSFNSYTLNRISLTAATAALDDVEYFNSTVSKVVEAREWTKRQLADLGFFTTDSKANFLFISHPAHRAEKLQINLRERGILVRHFKLPMIDNYLRITIGTMSDMEKVISVLREIL